MAAQTVVNLPSFNAHAQQGLILSLFEGLRDGESFIFASGKDPSPLCRELDQINAANLRWEFLKKSPGEWTVRIHKSSAEEIAAHRDGGCCGMCGG
jgi:uncharacterized protein (DUF2249 family)